MELILRRFISDEHGTFGTLMVENQLFFSVEKPWENNEPFNSCIPTGKYTLIPAKSSKYGHCLAVINDTDITRYQESHSKRYAVLIHAANWERDVLGCIGLGDNYIPSKHMVTNSRQSIIDFYNLVDPNQEHNLEITEINYG